MTSVSVLHMSVLNFSNQYLHDCCDKLNIPKHSNKPKHKLLSLLYEALNIQNTLIQYDELKQILDKRPTIGGMVFDKSGRKEPVVFDKRPTIGGMVVDASVSSPVIHPNPKVFEQVSSPLTAPKRIIIRVKKEPTEKRPRQTRAPEKIKELVNTFAVEHKEDDRKLFKTAWQQWIVSDEINKLLHDEYSNDSEREIIIDKLYFSARYYHRKKELKKKDEPKAQTQEEETPKKRNYNKTDKTILNNIDNHLQSLEKDEHGFAVKPSVAFDKFMESYGKEYEIYKKIFKNRFYMFEKNIVGK